MNWMPVVTFVACLVFGLFSGSVIAAGSERARDIVAISTVALTVLAATINSHGSWLKFFGWLIGAAVIIVIYRGIGESLQRQETQPTVVIVLFRKGGFTDLSHIG